MNKLTNKLLTLVVTSLFLSACNSGGGGGSYQSKPNNFPQIDCYANAIYSVTPPTNVGNLIVTPVVPDTKSMDSYVLFNNKGNGYLGAGLEMDALYVGGYIFNAKTTNTTPSTPYPDGVCSILNVPNTSSSTGGANSIYAGGTMIWTNCQAPVESGTMYFTADYQLFESTGVFITSGNISFNCSVESPNVTHQSQLLLDNKVDLKALIKEIK